MRKSAIIAVFLIWLENDNFLYIPILIVPVFWDGPLRWSLKKNRLCIFLETSQNILESIIITGNYKKKFYYSFSAKCKKQTPISLFKTNISSFNCNKQHLGINYLLGLQLWFPFMYYPNLRFYFRSTSIKTHKNAFNLVDTRKKNTCQG